MAKRRVAKPAAQAAFAYTNRRGETYYLHEGTTKTGKPRYFFAKTVGDRPLAEVPEGFEVSESINAVVSVRRIRNGESSISAADVDVVRAAVKHHGHLRDHEVRVVGQAIVVFEPSTRREELRDLESALGTQLPQSFIEERMKKSRYAPVMKFEPEGDKYAVFRMTYSGRGGWSYPLALGKLPELVPQFVPPIGTESFFDLH